MDEKETLSLVQLYDSFRSPEFVMNHSHAIKENGYEMFTAQKEIEVGVLGKMTLGTAYIPRYKRAIPVLFLSDEQVKMLRDRGIHFVIKKRIHPSSVGTYIGFPNRYVFEKIVSI
jgi:hypothetical protein